MDKKRLFAILLAVVLILIIVIVVAVVVINKDDDDDDDNSSNSWNKADFYKEYSKAAVATDRKECSKIGKKILADNGTVVDASVASLFCIGLLNMHSTGIGGGGFMNVYIRSTKKSIIYDFRETAPAASTQEMFKPKNASSVIGGLSIAIPGNIKGLHHVWKAHGKLEWKKLIEPTIKIAEEGFEISKDLGEKIARDISSKLNLSEGFKELLQKPDGTWYKAGEKIKNEKLAKTLKIIADKPEDFYTGELAKEIVKDIQEAGGIITLDDLKNYAVAEREPLTTDINGMKFFMMPPPGGGAVVAMTLNILKGFDLSSNDITTNEKLIQTTHKIIEALKFAFARRPLLGDPSFEQNVTRVLEAMLNQSFAETLRQKINMSGAYPDQTYYGGYYSQDQDPYGTTHVSILGKNGDAVATTDTINYGFGSGVRSTRNGIIYNNEMDDFSTPGLKNLWGYLPAEANYIKPGKRPLSSMSPSIVTNADGDVIMVAGASGGSRIITATALTLIRKLFLGMDLDKAISEYRIHTHLLPYEVYVNKQFKISDALIDGLKKLNHKIVESSNWAAVQSVYRKNKDGIVEAVSDPRKGGIPDGY
ncbi:glutathione hydrolase 1 proenzyme-like [Hydractinia symbiolongicarpus]|uniref:glutathione hydrolase 1 proenzyme-like n=1 Tax=Hydractinia symbiolongicarpus TaxID=13093 RepID=UPI00254E52AC|nr:glutathione hydrolase 1 proenzyme-like [Hydractinia symbiolongicarpus]XP_057307501.1 glutathione hydrolase 1 proenzyme-like [Hydractinia symbiolongicarpus]